MDVAVDVILDERHIVAREHREQRPLVGFGHRGAERVVEARRQHAGSHRFGLEQVAERAGIDAALGVDGQLERLHAQHFKRVQQTHVGR